MRWLNENSKAFLQRGYLLPGQTAEERISDIASRAEELLKIEGFAKRFYNYMEKGYYSLSSPVWANFGQDRGLPISCFGSYVWDHMADILLTHSEVGMMTKYGWGTTGYFGDLRGRGSEIKDNGHSSGAVHFMRMFDSLIDVVAQGAVRRGTFATYLPIEHPDAKEFLDIRSEGNPIQHINFAVTVTDKWLEEMRAGDEEKRALWAKVIQKRSEHGQPYIFFTDNVNNNTVDVYKDQKKKIYMSNVCSEIMLPVNETESFVCCLSSMNLEYYDEWKDTDAVEVMTYFLDAVMQEFIDKLEAMRDSKELDKQQAFKFMERAYNFAYNHRALGLGVFGWHSYLQAKMIPMESTEANEANIEIFKRIKEQAYKASEGMAKKFGEAPYTKGYGRRNTTLLAIAPTTSSAFIIWQASQSIEPWFSNCYVKDLAKLKVTIKNKYLAKLLEEKGRNDRETWNSIRDRDGSVQHLDFLTTQEKNVFKTFTEINQYVLVDQAADRQKFIDQGQSLNLMIDPKTPVKDINALYLEAWKQGIKTLYYQHSKSAAQELTRKIVCSGCEA